METFPKVRPSCGKVHQGRETFSHFKSFSSRAFSHLSLCIRIHLFPLSSLSLPFLLRPAEVCCLQCSKTAKMGRRGNTGSRQGSSPFRRGGGGGHILVGSFPAHSPLRIFGAEPIQNSCFYFFSFAPARFPSLRKDPLLAFLFPTEGWWDLRQFPICVCEREGRRRRRHFDGIFFFRYGGNGAGLFSWLPFLPPGEKRKEAFPNEQKRELGENPFSALSSFSPGGKKGKVRSLPSSSFSPPSFFFQSLLFFLSFRLLLSELSLFPSLPFLV